MPASSQFEETTEQCPFTAASGKTDLSLRPFITGLFCHFETDGARKNDKWSRHAEGMKCSMDGVRRKDYLPAVLNNWIKGIYGPVVAAF